MTPRRAPWAPSLLRLLFAVLLLAVLARVVGFGEALSVLAQVDPLYVLPVLALFGVGQVLSCVRWRLALSQIVAVAPRLPTLLRLYLIGMFVNLGLPTTAGGDIVRAEFTRRLVGTRGSAYASIIADRLIGALAIVLVAAGATLFAGRLIDDTMRWYVTAVALALPAVLVLLVLGLRRHGDRLAPRRLQPFAEALRSLGRRPRILSLSLAIAILVQTVGVILPIGILAAAMGIDVPLALHFILVPIIVLATLIPLAPNGIGVRETAFVVLYGNFGVGAGEALALGLGWSLVLVAYGLAGGVAMIGFAKREHPVPCD